MSTGYAETKGDLFNFEDITEDTVVSVPIKDKEKKNESISKAPDWVSIDKKKEEESISFYTKALNKLNTNLNLEATKTNVVVNTGFCDIVDVETTFVGDKSTYSNYLGLPEDGQVVRSKQSLEGSYKSIWKKPKIRQNIDFEEEMDPDEEPYFDDEELNCDIKAPYTQPSSILEETPEESLEDTPAVPEEELEVERTYVPGPDGECVEVVNELQNILYSRHKVSKKPLMENIKLRSTPLTTKEVTKIHKNISDLHYIK